MNILFFTEISPFPINRGERIRSYGLIKSLSETGHTVNAIINNEEKIDLKKYAIKNVIFHEFTTHNKNFIEIFTGLYYFKKQKKILTLFNKLISQKKIDLIFLDYAFIGQYITFFKKKGIPVIYGTHNSQSNLTFQQPSKNLIKKIYNYYRTNLQRAHERIYFKNADAIITVSKEDKVFHSKFLKKDNLYVIPNFLDENRYTQSFIKEDYFIMSANFIAYQNQEGFKWFLENVWNDELDSKSKLLLVGNYSKQLYKSINNIKKFKNITAIGKVDDMIPYIGKAKAVIIPLLHGSGSRLKCLEAMALKTTIIGTSKGVEGIQSKFIEIANDSMSFRELLLIHSSNQSKTNNGAYSDFLKSYSLKVNKLKIDKIINSLINSNSSPKLNV